jgi:hypothetical protein
VTPRLRRSLARYIFTIAKEFGLRDWDMYLLGDPPDTETAAASVECIYGRRKANIRVGVEFHHASPEEQREVVLHELIHVHFAQTRALIDEVLPDLLGKPAFVAFREAYRQADEHATDAIANAIADRYPLWEG